VTTRARPDHRPAWVVAFLAAVVTVVVGLLGAGPASATAVPTAQNGVGASTFAAPASVGPSASISPDQRPGNDPPQPGIVVATGVAANSGARSSNVVDDVMAETLGARQRNITSSYRLTADEALTAGQRWVGHGYAELGKPGSGVFRSVDGTRQFRMDANSLMGNHPPRVPHVHLEIYAPGARVPSVNNHIRLVD
jgi:hypothetical protein